MVRAKLAETRLDMVTYSNSPFSARLAISSNRSARRVQQIQPISSVKIFTNPANTNHFASEPPSPLFG
jgi:hypothetical protein